MRLIAVVSPYPDSSLGLNEYTAHLLKHLTPLAIADGIEIAVLADIGAGGPSEYTTSSGVRLIRCWRYNDWRSPFSILKRLRELKPDLIWFNLLYSTFGDSKIPAFSGLLLPWLCRLSGFRTAVTLHQLHQCLDLRYLTARPLTRLERYGLALATRFLLSADQVVVPLQRYADLLAAAGSDNVTKIPHGFFYAEAPATASARAYLLVFGKFGSYKRLEFALESFTLLRSEYPRLKLLIAGASHPSAAGYLEKFIQRHSGDDAVRAMGYVPEDEIPKLFAGAQAVFLPYLATAGLPSVALAASAFGVPIIAPDLPDVRSIMAEEELHITTFTPGDARAAAAAISSVLHDRNDCTKLAEQNRAAAARMPMSKVADEYYRLFRASAQ